MYKKIYIDKKLKKVINLKSKIIVINNMKKMLILFFTIIFIAFLIINTNAENIENIQNSIVVNDLSKNVITTTKTTTTNTIIQNDILVEVNGNMVIGKLEIPKIDLVTYILPDTNKDTLNKSVTKLCGPKINGVGNLCITGHNYHKDNMFGNLKELKVNDKIYLTDNKENRVEYMVYDIYKVYPEETGCLSQNTEGEREVTLITCTGGAIKRLIVKAREIYD